MGGSSPLVSVILPTHNRADLVGRAIQSALSQTYKHIELVVVDDGSEDNTPAIVKEFDDDRIIFIRNEQNKGQAAAENTGIEASNGKYVAFLDSDVEWLPRKIEKQVTAVESAGPDVAAVYCSYYNGFRGYLREGDTGSSTGDIYRGLLAGDIGFATSTLLIERGCLDDVGMWDTSLDSNIDFDLCLRISRQYRFEYVDEPLLVSHDHTGPRITTDKKAKFDGLEQIIDKWGGEMEAEFGSGYLETFRRQYVAGVYRDISLWHARNGRRRRAVDELRNYLHYSDIVDLKFALLFALSFLSTTAHELVRYVWFRTTGESRTEAVET